MKIDQGAVYLTDHGEVQGSWPAKRPPIEWCLQRHVYNVSGLTILGGIAITANTRVPTLSDNVYLPTLVSRLPPGDYVFEVTAVVTLNKNLSECCRSLSV